MRKHRESFDTSLRKFNEALTELKNYTITREETAEVLLGVFSQMKEAGARSEEALLKSIEEGKARAREHYEAVSQFEPRPIAGCGFCGRPIYAEPRPTDLTASLCDSCHEQLRTLILAAPMLANAILSALRLQGELK